MTLRALLFDLDGTLIDSMPHHHQAWIEWHARRGNAVDPASLFATTAGRSNAEILLDLFPNHTPQQRDEMAAEKESLYRQRASEGLELIAGARAFVGKAREAGMRLAVCTASTPENIAFAFDRHGIAGWVDAVTSPADVRSGPGGGARLRGKPHPDIFLEAATRLGVSPSECLVFEDAPLGVEAARRAGMMAVALTTTLSAEAFPAFDNLIAITPDFTSLDFDTLKRAHRQAHEPTQQKGTP